jgi:hypothetical protein
VPFEHGRPTALIEWKLGSAIFPLSRRSCFRPSGKPLTHFSPVAFVPSAFLMPSALRLSDSYRAFLHWQRRIGSEQESG